MNDAGVKHDPIGLSAFVDRIRSGDTARYDQVIQQTCIRVEQ
ncbi:MAG: hypothetical protein WB764_19275 [Xanthobacteraceae bacterium]